MVLILLGRRKFNFNEDTQILATDHEMDWDERMATLYRTEKTRILKSQLDLISFVEAVLEADRETFHKIVTGLCKFEKGRDVGYQRRRLLNAAYFKSVYDKL